MHVKVKRLLWTICLAWGLFPSGVLAQESTPQNNVNIQVDRLEGTTGTQSNSSTSGNGLFHADETQQISIYQQQQRKKQEQQAQDLFTNQEVQTTHEAIKQESFFTADSHPSVTTASSAAAEESFRQTSALAPLTDNQWFQTAAVMVFVAAVWISYQLYKRDKHAGY